MTGEEQFLAMINSAQPRALERLLITGVMRSAVGDSAFPATSDQATAVALQPGCSLQQLFRNIASTLVCSSADSDSDFLAFWTLSAAVSAGLCI